MSSEKFQEHTPERQEIEDEVSVIDKLPGKFGFSETEALGETRLSLIEAMVSNDAKAVTELVGRYYELAQEVVNKLQGEDFSRAQIGVLLAMGLIRRDAGRTDDYISDLEDILEYATAVGYDDIAFSLRSVWPEASEPLSEAEGA